MSSDQAVYDDALTPEQTRTLRYFSASKRGQVLEIQELLNEDSKFNVLQLDEFGNTALHWAAGAGHLDCVKYLVETLKLPLDSTNKFGDTPLHKATWRGALDVVKYLVEKDAKLDIVNSQNKRPVDLAHHLEVKSYLQSYEGDDEDYEEDEDEEED
ncbi:hypothetical protein C9374_003142 [Naegleria lovaniensis]|uniref:Uncharacterized protein n=1 Tax=Naegleria lovaniensis TaxID=51637 RepID=A0AA88GU02_NAELO|nr:uncharacterized protein C9374_003142 [Naegleria lovaniensis]KAG2385993.1 hypothetical protein C9374_003142 [Naegleria lovaniensis]